MTETPVNLEYAAPGDAQGNWRRAHIFRRFVLVCAIAPMAIGLGIVLLYWLFDWDGLILAGFWMLPLGGLMVLAGLIFAILWGVQRHKHAKLMQTKFPARHLVLLILLLLSNFAVALGCMWVGVWLVMQPRVIVNVTNDSGAALDQCAVISTWSPRGAQLLGSGSSMQEIFKLNRTSGLHLHVEQAGKSKDVPLTAPPGGGGLFDSSPKLDITIGPDLKVDVQSTPGD